MFLDVNIIVNDINTASNGVKPYTISCFVLITLNNISDTTKDTMIYVNIEPAFPLIIYNKFTNIMNNIAIIFHMLIFSFILECPIIKTLFTIHTS